jgi:hypothetical protein
MIKLKVKLATPCLFYPLPLPSTLASKAPTVTVGKHAEIVVSEATATEG